MGAFAPRFDEEDEDYFNSQLEQLQKLAHWHNNKSFLDKLTEDYIRSLVGGEKYYKKIFFKEDWESIEGIGLKYIKIPPEEHGMTTPYVAEYYIEVNDNNGEMVLKSAIPKITMLYGKIIKIKTYVPANGFLIIKDKET